MSNQTRFILKQGLIAGLIGILTVPITHYFDLTKNYWWSAIGTLLPIAYVTYHLFRYRRLLPEKKMAFDLAFRLGFLTLMVSAALTVVFGFCYVNYIQPGQVEKLLEIQRQAAVDQGILDEEQISDQIEMARKGMTNAWITIGLGLLSYALINAIVSLIVAIILRRGSARSSAAGE